MNFAEARTVLYGAHSPAVKALAEQVCAAVLATGLMFEQSISLPLQIHYFKHNGVVVAASLHRGHVNLHFYKGSLLKDPVGKLQGHGKQLRHLRFAKPADVDTKLIQAYVKAAYALNA